MERGPGDLENGFLGSRVLLDLIPDQRIRMFGARCDTVLGSWGPGPHPVLTWEGKGSSREDSSAAKLPESKKLLASTSANAGKHDLAANPGPAPCAPHSVVQGPRQWSVLAVSMDENTRARRTFLTR